MPKVSIIIPSYNSAHYLPDAIESCLAQTEQDFEIIVVNDGSSDNTAEVAKSYEGIRYIERDNGGLASARNTGIEHAKGEFIQFLDADDILLPEKLAHSLAVFRDDPDAAVVVTDYENRSEDLSRSLPDMPRAEVHKADGYIFETLINTTSTLFGVHCALIKSDWVRRMGGFVEGMRSVEDWNFWVRLGAAGAKFHYLDEVLVWYRHPPDSLSKRVLPMARYRLESIIALRNADLPSEANLEEKIAGRYHALAMLLWYEGERDEARQVFRQAIETHPSSHKVRQFFYYATYFLPPQIANGVVDGIVKLKSMLG